MKYKLDIDMADNTLQNILTSCKQSPSVTPLNKIVTTQKKNTRFYERFIIIASLVLLLTFLLPVYILPLSKLTENLFTPKPVTLIHHYQENNTLYLEFAGDNINFKDAYMVTEDGETYPPASFNKAQKRISFPYIEGQRILFHIPVKNGPEVQIMLTPIYE